MVSKAYGDDDFSRLAGDEDGYEEEEDENSKPSVGKSIPKSTAAQSIISFVRNFLTCTNSAPFSPPPLFLVCLVSVEKIGLDIRSSL